MVANNAFIIKEMEEEAKKRGREEGKEEGEEKGIALTKKIFKLNAMGIDISKIAKECDITVEKVKKILE